MTAKLSIVIPTYQAAGDLGQTLRALAADLEPGDEVVIADGGSTDATLEVAASAGARVVIGVLGRGPQLAAGAAAASGDWLLFLHGDTVLADRWRAVAAEFMAAPENGERAGYFRLALGDPSPAARRVERLAAWRARVLGLPYGDQGLLIGRALYDRCGGFRPLVMMEDVDLVRRLGRRRLVELPAAAVTSAARYHRDGWWARPIRNLVCLGLFFLGLPAPWIARAYR
ncbi:MAG: glycosyltransferase [Alphaproteobacteria bacterium]|nr:glycosyltransferase [Alphaproteobacteria bacterium]